MADVRCETCIELGVECPRGYALIRAECLVCSRRFVAHHAKCRDFATDCDYCGSRLTPSTNTDPAMHPSVVEILEFFKWEHLPERLQDTSRPVGELAMKMASELPDCSEKTAGLRKLLEAKDCFVRASLRRNG